VSQNKVRKMKILKFLGSFRQSPNFLHMTNMSKSEKTAHLRHVSANNFCGVHIYKFFQPIRNQRKIQEGIKQ
jgi:hypothetical protein